VSEGGGGGADLENLIFTEGVQDRTSGSQTKIKFSGSDPVSLQSYEYMSRKAMGSLIFAG
jgi:hypothetical protein